MFSPLCSALHNGPWSAFRITRSYWFLWIQGTGLWLYSQPACPSGCARKLDCWSDCWRKQICLSPEMQGTGRTSAQRCRCAKQWWHELRSNCPLLLHQGAAGSYCEEGGCKGEPSVTSLMGQVYWVLFGLSTRKQPEKQGRVWQRLYMDTDPKKTKQSMTIICIFLYHVLQAISVLLAMILTAGDILYDKETGYLR